ncbi:MAG TPA: VWA domain-containing protein [Pyrinomonadaceae bacterium]|nr:VWA domain-containing protein [Pyrinomonadaceae bacterium]
MSPNLHTLILILCLLTPASSAGAQESSAPVGPSSQATGEAETIRVETDLVDLNVSVFSRDPQRAIGELQQKDFLIREDGELQEIKLFASASTPFDLVLLLDLSGSIADKLDLVRKSAQRFAEAARPIDRVGIVTFTDVPRLVAPLTFDREEIRARLKKMEKPQGGTSFWDALHGVLAGMLGEARGTRRSAVIVMTDGVDNALPDVPGDGSRTSFDELLETVRRSESIVLPIYLDTEREMIKQRRATPGSYIYARQQLVQLALESGSTIYQARKLEDLKGVYEQVIRDLSTVYSIGYRPTNKRRDGSWRAVSVQISGRPDLTARTKRGYYARQLAITNQ